MSLVMTDLARQKVLEGDLDLKNDTLKYILLGVGYTFDKDDEYVADVVANELSGTGYTGGFAGSGRKEVPTRTAGHNGTSHKAYLDCADSTWTALDAGTIGTVGVWKPGTSDADSLFVGAMDITDKVTNGDDWTLQIHADGLFTLA